MSDYYVRISHRNEYSRAFRLSAIFGQQQQQQQNRLQTLRNEIAINFKQHFKQDREQQFTIFAVMPDNDYVLVDSEDSLNFALESTRKLLICQSVDDLKTCVLPIYERSKIMLETALKRKAFIDMDSENSTEANDSEVEEKNVAPKRQQQQTQQETSTHHTEQPKSEQQQNLPVQQQQQLPASNSNFQDHQQQQSQLGAAPAQQNNFIPQQQQQQPQQNQPQQFAQSRIGNNPQGNNSNQQQSMPPTLAQLQHQMSSQSMNNSSNQPQQQAKSPVMNQFDPNNNSSNAQQQQQQSAGQMMQAGSRPPTMEEIQSQSHRSNVPGQFPPQQSAIPGFPPSRELKNPADFAPPHPSLFNLPPSAAEAQKMNMMSNFSQPPAQPNFPGGNNNQFSYF